MDHRDKDQQPIERTEEERDDLETPLGIARTPVPQDESDRIRAHEDEIDVRRRRERAAAEKRSSGMDDVNRDHRGATGIDMGAGGHGMEPDR